MRITIVFTDGDICVYDITELNITTLTVQFRSRTNWYVYPKCEIENLSVNSELELDYSDIPAAHFPSSKEFINRWTMN